MAVQGFDSKAIMKEVEKQWKKTATSLERDLVRLGLRHKDGNTASAKLDIERAFTKHGIKLDRGEADSFAQTMIAGGKITFDKKFKK